MSDSYKIYASQDYVDSKGLPDGQGAYQQLVTDGEGKAKWEDKTFYEETVEEVVIPEQTRIASSGEDLEYIRADVSEKCVVIFDGVRYECEPKPLNTGFMQMYRFGNLHALSASWEDTGEPFGVEFGYALSGDNAWCTPRVYFVTQDKSEHTISVLGVKVEVTPLDAKFLPTDLVKSVNGITPDTEGNVEVSCPVQSVENYTPDENANISFDYAKEVAFSNGLGRLELEKNEYAGSVPFWKEKTHSYRYNYIFEWDGDTTDLSESNYIDMHMRYCGPFDISFTAEDLEGYVLYISSSGFGVLGGHVIKESDIYTVGTSSKAVSGGGQHPAIIFVAEEDVGVLLDMGNSDLFGSIMSKATFPSAGMWVGKYASGGVGALICQREVAKRLDTEFLPTTVPVLSAVPTISDAGKILRVQSDGSLALETLQTEEWTFTLDDGTEVVKNVVVL